MTITLSLVKVKRGSSKKKIDEWKGHNENQISSFGRKEMVNRKLK